MTETAPPIDLRPDHWAILRDVLRRHIPDRKVLVFGSRAAWTAKDYSDLDLAILGTDPLPVSTISALAEGFSDSDLPFKVDLVDWMSIDEAFRDIIRRDGVAVQAPTERSIKAYNAPTSLLARRESEIPDNTEDSATKRGWLFNPPFPPHWQACSLYSMANWVNGIAFRNIQFSDTGRPVIKIAEIKNGISGQTKFTQQTFDESVFVRPSDLLFSWFGQPETSIDAFWWRGPEGWLNQHVFKVDPIEELDTEFFYYLLRYLKPNFVEIARNKQTTGLGHVTKRDLAHMEVAYPSAAEQRRIAHILGTLDDKIELNRRMNETLEAMAQAIFKDWFVDFGPVRAKIEGRRPYLPAEIWDLFPAALDDENIPDGWRVGTVGECFRLTMGQSPPGRTYNDNGVGLPFFQGRTDFGYRYPKSRKYCSEPIRIAECDDTLVSVRAPVGDINMALEKCCLGRGVSSLRHRSGARSFTYYSAWAIQRELRQYEHSGTVFGAINRKNFEALNVLDPIPEIVPIFERRVGPLDDRIRRNVFETHTLAILRDMLLPKLVSGEWRVEDAQSFLDRAV